MLKISNLTYPITPSFGFQDVSLRFKGGEKVAILGGSYSGKQTLIMLITAQRHLPTGDSLIEIDGVPCERNPNYLSQYALIPETPSLPSIKMYHYAEYMGSLYPTFDMKKFFHYSNMLQIEAEWNLRKQPLGVQKKFLLALSLSIQPPLIIASNLFYHITPPDGELIRTAIHNYHEKDSTMLFIGADLPYIEDELSHCIALKKGEIIYENSAKNLEKDFTLYIDQETKHLMIQESEQGDPPWKRSLFFTNYKEIEPKFQSLILTKGDELS